MNKFLFATLSLAAAMNLNTTVHATVNGSDIKHGEGSTNYNLAN